MPIAARHIRDQQPFLIPLPFLTVRRVIGTDLMGALQQRRREEIDDRFAFGHRAYVAFLDDQPAAFGWLATSGARIGELGIEFDIPLGDGYLWNFVTLPAFRGMGIYPRLLDAIVQLEKVEAERFWVAYAPENKASGSGIAKAGFTELAELSFDEAGRAAVRALITGGGQAASRLLGVPEASGDLALCWRCVRAGNLDSPCTTGSCSCDYQRPAMACGA
jgi:GNAT superfamily N-acetyltransferase